MRQLKTPVIHNVDISLSIFFCKWKSQNCSFCNFFFRRKSGNDRHSHSITHWFFDRFLILHARHNVESANLNSTFLQLLFRFFSRARTLFSHNQRLLQNPSSITGRLLQFPEFLIVRSDDDQLILIKRNIFAMFLIYDRPCKADIHCMIQYFLHHFGAVCLNDLELLIRIFLIEFHKNLRKQILCRYRRRRNRNTVFFFLFILQKCLFNFFLQRNNLFCRIIQ